MGKIVRIKESQLKNIIGRLMNEQVSGFDPTKGTKGIFPEPKKVPMKPSVPPMSRNAPSRPPYDPTKGTPGIFPEPKKTPMLSNRPPMARNGYKEPVAPSAPAKLQYHDKADFPFNVGDKNESLIAPLQKALGLPLAQQKGFFGPVTVKKLAERGIDISKTGGLDKVTYSKIVNTGATNGMQPMTSIPTRNSGGLKMSNIVNGNGFSNSNGESLAMGDYKSRQGNY